MITRRPPTCLGCLRRALTPSITASASGSPSIALTQVRGKKKSSRPGDEEGGIVVRLLKDITEYGPKDTILRAPRGRVRNVWYPDGKAEYMTRDRFRQLGVDKSIIVERDPTFGLEREKLAEDDVIPEVEDSIAMVQQPKAQEATALLMNMLPATLTFYRAAVPASNKPRHGAPASLEAAQAAETKGDDEQPVYRSPLVARNAAVSTQSAASAPPQPIAIFGSVSTSDVAARVKELLSAHAEASLIPFEAKHVKIEGLVVAGSGDVVPGSAVEGDKVKQLGTWEITIQAPGGAEAGVKPIKKLLEVVDMEENAGQ